MIARLLSCIAALFLSACSGPVPPAGAQEPELPGAPFPQSERNAINCETLRPCASVGRIMKGGGGRPGDVSNALIVRSLIGPDVTHYEWAALAIMDNHARAGENVAVYGQGNAYSTGQTWGGVFEVVQRAPAKAALVGLEVNLRTMLGEDGNQLGVHVVGNGEGGTAAVVADGHGGSWRSAFRAQGSIGTLLDASRAVDVQALAVLPASLLHAPPAVAASPAACLPVSVGGTNYCLPLLAQ